MRDDAALAWALLRRSLFAVGVVAYAAKVRGQSAVPQVAPVASHCLPAPQAWKPETPPEGVREVRYDSASGPLKAWFALPPDHNSGDLLPVIVYLHGGFSFTTGDFEQARPFLANGYAVMTPMLRAENGNPGCFEMFAGEVDDVLAAIRWVKAQPMIDKDHVYVIGHSIGGGMSALVCLRPDSGVRSGGAISGLYNENFILKRKAVAPFDTDNKPEMQRRLFLYQAQNLRVPFIFYLETTAYTPGNVAGVDKVAKLAGVPLSALLITGDHYSIIQDAIPHFIATIRSQNSSTSAK